MAYTPVVVDNWSGLNLRDDPYGVGLDQATDMTNVDIDQHGRLRSRDGYTQTGNPTTGIGSGGCYYDGYIVTKVSTNAVPVAVPSGTNGTTSAGGPGHNNSMVRHGTPTASRLYFVDGTTTMRRYDGSWTNVTIPISASVIAVTADNRLIVGDQSDQVAWSDPEDPEIWSSSDTQSLAPGDSGFGVTALVTWRELTFAFKADKFFVITGFSIDGDGGTLLDYRPVTAGVGAWEDSWACSGDEGVYFIAKDGIYVTNGDTPALISGPLGYPIDTFAGSHAPCYFQRRLYVPTSAATYVLDVELNAWLKWTARFIMMCVVPDTAVGVTPGVYVVKNTSGLIARLSSTARTDNGSTDTNGDDISWSYRSGWTDLGSPDRKTIREISFLAMGQDFGFTYYVDGAAGATGTVDTNITLVSEVRVRLATRGRFIGYEVGGQVGGNEFSLSRIHRITLRIRDTELPK